LKRLNEDFEQVAYIISHDLKSPVRNISAFMKLLISRYGTSFNGEALEFMEHSKSSAERLSQQIDDLLVYCRISRNLPPVAPIDLGEMIKTIRMETKSKGEGRNVELICIKELPVLQQMHSSLIHSVFQNLIDNAIKFNKNERIEIKIDCKEEAGSFTFSVSDNGIGINSAYIGKLFKVFRQLHSGDQYKGTGIGLALSKKIVNFYSGNIWCESELGKGSTFYFTLPQNTASPSMAMVASHSGQVLRAA
jgi:light-regulated signal transduction histidine kinase (bacteriophytochrome)